MHKFAPWISQTCENPNVEQVFAADFELLVKTVTSVPPNAKISLNRLTNFDGGNFKGAIRLLKETGSFCANSRCSCRVGQIDTSVALKCRFINDGRYSSQPICIGSFGPWVEAPDLQKNSLGFNQYSPAKKWECDSCKFTCKFSAIQNTNMRSWKLKLR